MDGIFVHLPIEEDIHAIGGHYQIHKELCMEIRGQSLLYLLGVAAYDRTCCGQGGCLFALVAGFLRRYRFARVLATAPASDLQAAALASLPASDLDEVPETEISEVEWIVDPSLRKEISEELKKKHPFVQVQFAAPTKGVVPRHARE